MFGPVVVQFGEACAHGAGELHPVGGVLPQAASKVGLPGVSLCVRHSVQQTSPTYVSLEGCLL